MNAYTAASVAFERLGGILYRQRGAAWWFNVDDGTVFDVSIPRSLLWAFDPHDRRYLKPDVVSAAWLLAVTATVAVCRWCRPPGHG